VVAFVSAVKCPVLPHWSAWPGILRALVFAVLLIPMQSRAEKRVDWIAGDGDFNEAGNWADGVTPGPTDIATFSPQGSINVSLKQDAAVAAIENNGVSPEEKGSDVAFDLGGKTLTIGVPDSESKLLPLYVQSQGVTGIRKVTFKEGSVVVNGVVTLSNVPSEDPAILVVGKGAELLSFGGGIGNVGKGELVIEDGGVWITEKAVRIGRTGQANGLVRLTGSGSEWNALGKGESSGDLIGIGSAGTGSLEILEGAKVRANIVQLAAHQTHAETPPGDGRGTLLVKNKGSSLECATLYVGGGVDRANRPPAVVGGVGSVILEDQGLVQASALWVFPFSTLSFAGGTLALSSNAVAENAVMEPRSVLSFQLGAAGSPAPFTVADLTIDQVKLSIIPGDSFKATVAQVFPLISYSGEIKGTFAGLENGGSVTVGTHTFSIDYGSGNDKSISLKVVR